jgi:hypothetical protein
VDPDPVIMNAGPNVFIGVLDCMRYFGLENVNFEKITLSKMKR